MKTTGEASLDGEEGVVQMRAKARQLRGGEAAWLDRSG